MIKRNQALSHQNIARPAVTTSPGEMTDTTTTALSSSGMFTIRNFCEWSGLCRTQVYALINRGDLRPVKCGRRTLIPSDEVMRWRAALPAFPIRCGAGERAN